MRTSSIVLELIRALLRLNLMPNDAPSIIQAKGLLTQANNSVWKRLLKVTNDNRVTGLLGATLKENELFDLVPALYAQEINSVLSKASDKNHKRLILFKEALNLLKPLGVTPLVLKSTALVSAFYPRLNAHQMHDIDVYVPNEQLENTVRLLCENGYSLIESEEDAENLEHESGDLLLDLHFRFRLFNQHDLTKLTESVAVKYPEVPDLLIFKPNPHLVHLVCHMNGHRDSDGYQLRWLLDLGLLLRHWEDKLDINVLEQLMPPGDSWFWLVRAANFFRQELGVPVLESIVRENDLIEPFTLSEAIRSHPIAAWPLTNARGWLRMFATLSGLRKIEWEVYPFLSDILWYHTDTRREKRAKALFDKSALIISK